MSNPHGGYHQGMQTLPLHAAAEQLTQGQTGPATAVHLAVNMEHPVEAAL